METFQRFFRHAVFTYKIRFGAINWKAYILFTLVTPVMQMFCYALLARYANGGNIDYWFIGNALVLTYMSSLFGMGTQFSNEREIGTLVVIIASPESKIATFLPRTVIFAIEGCLNVIVGFAFGFFVFGFNISIGQFLSLVVLCFVASFVAAGFGVMISSLALLTRDLNLLLNVSSMLLLGLTGANFPLERLPQFLQFLPKILPLTRSIKLSHYIMKGETLMSHSYLVFGEIFMGLSLMIIGMLLFKFIEKKAITDGTLNLI